MTLNSAIALTSAMVILAMLPSLSVMTVVARSASLGFIHGAATSLGIVAGDLLYILLAIYGLTVLAEQFERLLLLIQYAGALYLIYLGISLWRSQSSVLSLEVVPQESLWSSFLAGFLLTLADQKAIFFYLSFFPAFVDLAALSLADTILVLAIAFVSVGGVKLSYALLIDRVRSRLPSAKTRKLISLLAGTVMMAVGMAIFVKS